MIALKETGKSQVILCGIEAHVCVLHTALDLIDMDYNVFLVCDAGKYNRAMYFRLYPNLLYSYAKLL